jgi:predicted  nucleic acid-binding Zn-ribbon protein
MKETLMPIEEKLSSIEDAISRIEVKQDVIYNQTGALTEEVDSVKVQLTNIEKHLAFNTHKIAETELELFKLRRE